MKATTVGIDLAKNLIQVHGVDERGKPVFRKQLKRNQVLSFFANVTPCLIGMEACCSAHYWARQLQKLGHTVKLMAPQFVKPYVKTNKNDVADAEAICAKELVRLFRDPASAFHQGQRLLPHESPDVWPQSRPSCSPFDCLAKRGRPCMCENVRAPFSYVNFSHVEAISGDLLHRIRLLAILRA